MSNTVVTNAKHVAKQEENATKMICKHRQQYRKKLEQLNEQEFSELYSGEEVFQ